jgi:hypothetical protein
MGHLHIGQNGFSIAIDDRALAHLKIVILSALRRGEGLSLTLRRDSADGSGRETFWIHPGTDLRFQFLGGRVPHINHDWLHRMADACAGPTGLFIMDEPPEQARAERDRQTA